MRSAREQLIGRALAAYSDSCTLPLLTPSCPFYRLAGDGCTCNEECRALLVDYGEDRPTESVAVLDGLVMTGVVRPLEVASGLTPFDATEIFMRELREPIPNASTTTLLLRASKHVSTPPDMRMSDDDVFLAIWAELARRGVPVERVLRVGAAPRVAASIASLLTAELPALLMDWRGLRDGCQAAWRGSTADYPQWFEAQVTEWFTRLLASDIKAFLNWSVPQKAVFVNLPPPQADPEAQWIWDRFTVTHLELWATESLILEWDTARGRRAGLCPDRVLAARVVDAEVVATAALDKLASQTPHRNQPAPDLSTKHFVQQALNHLRSGNQAAAAEKFTALAYMNPADGDALNNLGFCIIPVSPVRALGPLARGAQLPMGNPALSLANRALVNHLLGDNQLAAQFLDQIAVAHGNAAVWLERECGVLELAVMALDSYVDQLRTHVVNSLEVSGGASSGSHE